MNSNNKIIIAVIVAAIIVGIIYIFYVQPQPTQAPSTAADQNIPTNQPAVAN